MNLSDKEIMDIDQVDQVNNNTNLDVTNSQGRKLCYRNLLDKIETINDCDQYNLDEIQELGNIIKQVNTIENQCNINQRYTHTDETILESIVLSSASDLLVKCVKAVDINILEYDPKDFANKIKETCTTNEDFSTEDIFNLIKSAQKIIPVLPKYTTLYGAYDLNALPQPKPKKMKIVAQKQSVERKEPKKIASVEQEEEGIEEIVKGVFEILKSAYLKNNNKPLNYYDFLIDTDSFSHTVENMFYCSFLVRDGRVRIVLDEDHEPCIQPVTKKALQRAKDNNEATSQIVTAITQSVWKTFKKPGYLQQNRRRQAMNQK